MDEEVKEEKVKRCACFWMLNSSSLILSLFCNCLTFLFMVLVLLFDCVVMFTFWVVVLIGFAGKPRPEHGIEASISTTTIPGKES